jgi:diguanylate cyclase
MNARAQEKRRVEHELRGALQKDELRLYYQAVVDIRQRKVLGVEALVRWDSPQLGFVSPGIFIPVAEETGLIGDIGEWILATAFEQGHRWHRAGFKDIRINVNVSVTQLREDSFAARLQQILTESGVNPGNLSLGLEITESELMENVAEMVPVINQFRKLGMAIYIDDFGTGYSSLSYLRQLPIDTLKIDTSFVRDISGDADAVAVVKAIIALARSLELRVIAEGVETEAQFSILAELGCDAVQGYLFSRPMPPEEIELLFGREALPAADVAPAAPCV